MIFELLNLKHYINFYVLFSLATWTVTNLLTYLWCKRHPRLFSIEQESMICLLKCSKDVYSCLTSRKYSNADSTANSFPYRFRIQPQVSSFKVVCQCWQCLVSQISRCIAEVKLRTLSVTLENILQHFLFQNLICRSNRKSIEHQSLWQTHHSWDLFSSWTLLGLY